VCKILRWIQGAFIAIISDLDFNVLQRASKVRTRVAEENEKYATPMMMMTTMMMMMMGMAGR